MGKLLQFRDNDIVVFNSETIKRKFLRKYDYSEKEKEKDKNYEEGYFDKDFGCGEKTYFYVHLELKIKDRKEEKYVIAVQLTHHDELIRLNKPCNCKMCQINKKKGFSYMISLCLFYIMIFISLFKSYPAVVCFTSMETGQRTIKYHDKLVE